MLLFYFKLKTVSEVHPQTKSHDKLIQVPSKRPQTPIVFAAFLNSRFFAFIRQRPRLDDSESCRTQLPRCCGPPFLKSRFSKISEEQETSSPPISPRWTTTPVILGKTRTGSWLTFTPTRVSAVWISTSGANSTEQFQTVKPGKLTIFLSSPSPGLPVTPETPCGSCGSDALWHQHPVWGREYRHRQI